MHWHSKSDVHHDYIGGPISICERFDHFEKRMLDIARDQNYNRGFKATTNGKVVTITEICGHNNEKTQNLPNGKTVIIIPGISVRAFITE